MRTGDIVVKIIEGGGARTATLARVKEVRNGIVYLGKASEPDDMDAYSSRTGMAIMGFRSYLAVLDKDEEEKIKTWAVK